MTHSLQYGLLFLIPFILSLTVHEYAHAWSAFKLGDDTAARLGRMTLNPLVHLDLFGTVIMPLLAILNPGMPFFGWAKPVPVNPAGFTRKVSMRSGMAITAAAGPLANVVLAVLATVALGVFYRFWPAIAEQEQSVSVLLVALIRMNVTLAVFNLLPVPPLDGSRIVDGLLPNHLRPGWQRFTSFSPFLMIGIFFAAPHILPGPTSAMMGLLDGLLNLIVH